MLEDVKINKDKYYKVGYSPYLKQYIMAITITWIAWYDRYYSISEDEYKWFDNDIDKLNHLADELYYSGVYHPRFIFSERSTDNNLSQIELFNKVSQLNLERNFKRQENVKSQIILIGYINIDKVISINPNLLYLRDKDGEFIRLCNNNGSIDISETSTIEELKGKLVGSDDLSVVILNKEEIGILKNYSWNYFGDRIVKMKFETEFSDIFIEVCNQGFIIDIDYNNGRLQKIDTVKWQKGR